MVVINPFSEKAKEMLKVDISKIEPSIVRIAMARSSEKNNDSYIDLDDREDMLSLFLLMQSLAKTPYAPEVSSALSAYESLMKERISVAFSEEALEEMSSLMEIHRIPELETEALVPKRIIYVKELGLEIPREDIFRMRQMKRGDPVYALRWYDAYDVVDIREHYVASSYMLVTQWELIDIYAKFLKRKCHMYIKGISTKMADVSHPTFEKISKAVSDLNKRPVSIENASSDLSAEDFPPCIRLALSGVSSGQRNYAITILLTSFLSYARILPSTRIFDRQSSFSLTQDDVEVLIKEVVPLIVDAGDRCEPPFFKEQPLELLNIFYHLGFGMNDTPNVSDYGKSKWYLPPSCTKVAENAPLLCRPDEFCSRVTWGIADREKAEEIVSKAAARGKSAMGEAILKLLLKGPRTLDEIAEALDGDTKEITSLLRTLSRNKLVGKRKIANPFVYYIRKKRLSSRGS